LFYLVVAIAFGVAAMRYFRSQEQRAMESLAEFVLARGTPAPMPHQPLQYFGLPAEDPDFYELRAVSQDGRTRGIFVRKRAYADRLDIFLVHLLPNDLRGYFYLTSTHGRLTKAAYFDDKPVAFDGATEQFEREVEFWKQWHQQKLQLEGN
jgi:hypothetical protein